MQTSFSCRVKNYTAVSCDCKNASQGYLVDMRHLETQSKPPVTSSDLKLAPKPAGFGMKRKGLFAKQNQWRSHPFNVWSSGEVRQFRSAVFVRRG